MAVISSAAGAIAFPSHTLIEKPAVNIIWEGIEDATDTVAKPPPVSLVWVVERLINGDSLQFPV
jgi:hypothetical protein